MLGLQKTDFFDIFRKYNILKLYYKNFRTKYEISTKLQHIVESAPRLINSIKRINYNNLFLRYNELIFIFFII